MGSQNIMGSDYGSNISDWWSVLRWTSKTVSSSIKAMLIERDDHWSRKKKTVGKLFKNIEVDTWV